METTISLLDFRKKMTKVLDMVEKGNRVLLSKKGHLKAVLISPEEYLTNLIRKDSTLAQIQNYSAEKKINELTNEAINDEIHAVREEISRL